MNTNKIGLKLADGEFYPVLEDGTAARKRLVVTTVQDGQPSVQIDLYRGQGPTVEDASYIGSLVVEGIPKMAKGEPDIRMDLGLAEDGTLTAFAQEASTGASQSLKVSLEALSEEEKYEVPDFEFSKEARRVLVSDSPTRTSRAPTASRPRPIRPSSSPTSDPRPMPRRQWKSRRARPSASSSSASASPDPPRSSASWSTNSPILPDRDGARPSRARGRRRTSAVPAPAPAPAKIEPPAPERPPRPAPVARGSAQGARAGKEGSHVQEARRHLQNQMGRYALGPLLRILPRSLGLHADREGQQDKESRPDHLRGQDLDTGEVMNDLPSALV